MPNDDRAASLRDQAIERVRESLLQWPNAKELPRDKAIYKIEKPDRVSAAWRINFNLHGQQIQLRLILSPQFPFEVPKVYLEGESYFLKWPHVNKDGSLCLWQPNWPHVIGSPDKVVKEILIDAEKLISQSLLGANKEDFIEEFLRYWEIGTPAYPQIWSLLSTHGPTRTVFYWKLGRNFLISDSENAGASWIGNFAPDSDIKTPEGETLFLRYAKGFSPADYPSNEHELVDQAITQGIPEQLLSGLAMNENIMPLVIGFETDDGMALAGLCLKPRSALSGGPGRRRKMACQSRANSRMLGGTAGSSGYHLDRLRLIRCDSEWIHARGGDPALGTLDSKHVALIGVGSVGSGVAALLAKTGIGKLTFIDYDVLQWTNVARHEAGGYGQVEKGKASALAKHLQQKYPHLQVEIIGLAWQDLEENDFRSQINTDLIISSTGNWASDMALNWYLSDKPGAPPVIYGWSEPYAAAGHAVRIASGGACFGCIHGEDGELRIGATSWQKDVLNWPAACGESYQPYGAVYLQPIQSMIAEMAIDTLMKDEAGSAQVTWLASTEYVNEQSGAWSEEWRRMIGEPEGGARRQHQVLKPDAGCPWCRGKGRA